MISSLYPASAPSLLLDFTTGVVDPRITYSRSGVAAYTDSNGVLKYAVSNAPRIDFNPITGKCNGLFIEPNCDNLIQYSEDVSNAYWVPVDVTVTANATTAPDGTLTADRVVENSSALLKSVRPGALTITSGAQVTVSAYIKASGINVCQIYINDNTTTANRVAATFDLLTGAVSNVVNAGTFTGALAANAQPVGNGWFRCSLTGTATGVTVVQTRFHLGDAAYTGTSTNGIFLWGAQLEQRDHATSYVPRLTSAAASRAADSALVTVLAPWFNATEGTLVTQSVRRFIASGTAAGITASLDDATVNNRIYLANADTFTGGVMVATVSEFVTSQGAFVADVPSRQAIAYKLNDVQYAYSGATLTTDTACAIPAVTQLRIGAIGSASRYLSGHIQRVMYYPRRLSATELQSITL